MNLEKIAFKLTEFIKNRVKKAGANGVIIGLSGGIDSALVLKLCKLAFDNDKIRKNNNKNQKILALMMPTKSSNKSNLSDAIALCEELEIEYKIIEIDNIIDSYLQNCEKINGEISLLRRGNLAARVRMCILYDYSATLNLLVVGTSNKSERMLGYGTIYGDLACAFNPLGELFKTEVFKLAKFLNLPQVFIDKKPSADLWENQSDEADLGFSYSEIDRGLKMLLKRDKNELLKLSLKLLKMLKTRTKKNKFKQKMPKIAQISRQG